MNRSRVAVLAAVATVAASLAVARPFGRPVEAPRGPVEGPSVPARGAVPAATPVPAWAGSLLAVPVSDGLARAIALLEVGRDAPAARLVAGFEEIGRLAWSPDGGTLAFGARRAANWDVYLVGRDGAGLRRLTAHAAFDAWPAWSPDGRQVAFVSYRGGGLGLYRLPVGGADADAVPLTEGGGRAIEPAWSPDGARIAFASWHEGAYRLEAVDAAGGSRRVVAEDAGTDLRSPAWAPGGRRLAYLAGRYGSGRLVEMPWAADPEASVTEATLVAVRAEGFAWVPGAELLAAVTTERAGRTVEVRDPASLGRRTVALLPPGAGDLAWTRGPAPIGLPPIAAGAQVAPAATGAHPGMVLLADVDVPGARMNAALAEDYAALRAAVRAEVGVDFLGTLSDLWRPPGFSSSGSSFFSWHKAGRAFDTQMELRGPGGRRDMVLVREEAGGRTTWRMMLRAAAQDGSAGRPLVEPGWTFAAATGEPEGAADGGRRGGEVPEGYWVDFTALAERHGWRRIASLTRPGLDWRRDWAAIEYWHYERRDGLRWFDAMREIYADAELAAELGADRLRALDIPLDRLARLGFPAGWLSEG